MNLATAHHRRHSYSSSQPTAANATPVLAGGGTPMDLGKASLTAKESSATTKPSKASSSAGAIGLAVGLMEGVAFGFQNYPVLFSILIPLGALLGDLTGAFIKRRIGIKPGGLLPVVDQVDFVVGAIVFSLPLAMINWQLAVTVLLITPPIHLFTNFLAYKLKLKRNPW